VVGSTKLEVCEVERELHTVIANESKTKKKGVVLANIGVRRKKYLNSLAQIKGDAGIRKKGCTKETNLIEIKEGCMQYGHRCAKNKEVAGHFLLFSHKQNPN